MQSIKTDYKPKPNEHSCTVCNVKYDVEILPDPGDTWKPTTVYGYFKQEGLLIDHADLLSHATTLAEIVRESRGQRTHPRHPALLNFPLPPRDPWPTMRTFFEIVSRAKYFVHFCSYGMSHQLIGALKLASMRVPVYGFASNIEANTRAELTEYPTEAPNFTAKAISSEKTAFDVPHQKLVIVDGLVAFKGSANLTNAGLRKADRGLDLSETVTDYAEVTTLNNKLFAPVWRRITAPDEVFVADYKNPW
jgi:phospholipase D-like protein